MGKGAIFKIRVHGVEYIGTAKEVYEKTGYSEHHFRAIANGYYACPEWLEFLPVLSEPKTTTAPKAEQMFEEWDSVVSVFTGVRWVRSGGKRLRVR